MGNTHYHKMCLVGDTPEIPIHIGDVNYLALGVGSVRGIALIGAYGELINMGLSNIKGVSGSSVGAIVGLGVVLGASTDEMIKRVMSPRVTEIIQNIKFIVSCGRASFMNSKPLRDQIVQMLIKHNKTPDITFQQLFEQTGKQLKVAAYNIESKKVEIFGYDTTPSNSVVDAIIASGSMPVAFPPEKQLGADGDCGCYIDGGVEVELPLREFPIKNTLGIYLFDKYRSREVSKTFFNGLSNEERCHIISIDVSRIGALQFDLTEPMKQWLYKQGICAVRLYYKS
jgi:hypothetical protein